jgi:hypothetical protein
MLRTPGLYGTDIKVDVKERQIGCTPVSMDSNCSRYLLCDAIENWLDDGM